MLNDNYDLKQKLDNDVFYLHQNEQLILPFIPPSYLDVNAVKICDGLFMGSRESSQDLSFIIRNKITHIINCCGHIVPNLLFKYGIKYLTFRWSNAQTTVMFDLKGRTLKQICAFIDSSLASSDGVLIHSLHGKSRSCCAMAAYLMHKFGWCLRKALEFIQFKRQDINPKTYFLRQLRRMEKRILTKVIRWTPDGVEARWLSLCASNDELIARNTFLNGHYIKTEAEKGNNMIAFNDSNIINVDSRCSSPKEEKSCRLQWSSKLIAPKGSHYSPTSKTYISLHVAKNIEQCVSTSRHTPVSILKKVSPKIVSDKNARQSELWCSRQDCVIDPTRLKTNTQTSSTSNMMSEPLMDQQSSMRIQTPSNRINEKATVKTGEDEFSSTFTRSAESVRTVREAWGESVETDKVSKKFVCEDYNDDDSPFSSPYDIDDLVERKRNSAQRLKSSRDIAFLNKSVSDSDMSLSIIACQSNSISSANDKIRPSTAKPDEVTQTKTHRRRCRSAGKQRMNFTRSSTISSNAKRTHPLRHVKFTPSYGLTPSSSSKKKAKSYPKMNLHNIKNSSLDDARITEMIYSASTCANSARKNTKAKAKRKLSNNTLATDTNTNQAWKNSMKQLSIGNIATKPTEFLSSFGSDSRTKTFTNNSTNNVLNIPKLSLKGARRPESMNSIYSHTRL